MSIQEARRAAFDTWHDERYPMPVEGAREYLEWVDKKVAREIAWNAALDSVCVNLPQAFEGNDFAMFDEQELLKALESAGIRYEVWK